MKKLLTFLFVTMLLFSCQTKEKYELVWSDEFDYKGLPDSNKWNYDTIGNSFGWGNNELQHYTVARTENARVEDGVLIIKALSEDGFPKAYTSARLTTKGMGDWLYGRIEVRAKVAGGKGIWPAIWMLPSEMAYGGWPKSGEIDIMEHVGYEPDSLYFTVHTEAFNHTVGTQKGKAVYVPDAEDKFYTYAIEWTENKCDFFLDDRKVFTFDKQSEKSSEWPFDHPFHLLLNVAVGGDWGGKYGVDQSIFPATMEVDYVRVYKK